MVSFFRRFQICISQSLSDRLRISVFKADGKSTETDSLGRHGFRFLRELARAIGRRAGKMALHAGQMQCQTTFQRTGINVADDLAGCSATGLTSSCRIALAVIGASAFPSQSRNMAKFLTGHGFGCVFDLWILCKSCHIGPECEGPLLVAHRY